MRFAFVTRRFWPLMNEPEYAAADLAEALQLQGHEVTVFSSRLFPAWPSSFSFRNCTVLRLPEKFPAFRTKQPFERALIKLLRNRQHQFDALVFFQPGTPPWELIEQAAWLGHRCIIRLDPAEIESIETCQEAFSDIMDSVDKKFGPDHCRLVTGSYLLAKGLNQLGMPGGWLPNGVREVSNRLSQPSLMDVSIPEQKQLAKESLAKSHPLLRIKPKEKLVVFAGPMTTGQRLDRWIRCWSKLDIVPIPKLWMIGDGNYQQQLWDLAIELGVENHVIFGTIFDDLSCIFQAADAFLLSDPLRIDSPFSLLAQSLRVPIIASFDEPIQDDVPQELLEGILVHQHDPSSLSDFVAEILNDPLASQEYLKMGGHKFANLHTMSECTRRLVELVNEMKSAAP